MLHLIMCSSHINTLIDTHLLVNPFSRSVSQSISLSDSQPVTCYRDGHILYDRVKKASWPIFSVSSYARSNENIPRRAIQWLVYLTRRTLLRFCESHGGFTHY